MRKQSKDNVEVRIVDLQPERIYKLQSDIKNCKIDLGDIVIKYP